MAEQPWAVPLPAPALLSQYEEILPGAADRILRMAEKATTGEIGIAERQAEAEIEAAKHGQAVAVSLTLVTIVCACVFFAVGNNFAGAVFLSFPVLMLIRSFLVARG